MHANNKKIQELYKKVKHLARDFKPQTHIIKNESKGTVIGMEEVSLPGTLQRKHLWPSSCTEIIRRTGAGVERSANGANLVWRRLSYSFCFHRNSHQGCHVERSAN